MYQFFIIIIFFFFKFLFLARKASTVIFIEGG